MGLLEKSYLRRNGSSVDIYKSNQTHVCVGNVLPISLEHMSSDIIVRKSLLSSLTLMRKTEVKKYSLLDEWNYRLMIICHWSNELAQSVYITRHRWIEKIVRQNQGETYLIIVSTLQPINQSINKFIEWQILINIVLFKWIPELAMCYLG